MKSKYFSRMLGWGLSSAMAVSLGMGAFAPVAAQGLMEWGEITTPSWVDHVIEPGSDIYDYAIGSDDGDVVYAVGAVNTAWLDYPEVPPAPTLDGIYGLSGSFDFRIGEVSLTWISTSTAAFEGTLIGDSSYLNGDFTAVMDAVSIWVSPPGVTVAGVAVVTGFIDGDPWPGDNDDEMTFSGFLHGTAFSDFSSVSPIEVDLIAPATICVNNWVIQPWISGDVSYAPSMFGGSIFTEPRAWSSSDGGVTWTDITGTVQDAAGLPGPFIEFAYGGVATAPDDGDWLVVAGTIYDHRYYVAGPMGMGIFAPFGFPPGVPALVASKDGAGGFSYSGDMVDTAHSNMMMQIYDVDVSIEMDDIHNIAIAGIATPTAGGVPVGPPYGSVYRLEAGTWLTGNWVDTTTYAGWDDSTDVLPPVLNSIGIVEVDFSTNFDVDISILCMGIHQAPAMPGPPSPPIPYLQSGIWETGGTWNGEAGFADAVQITDDGEELWGHVSLRSMGMAIPDDYDGSDPGARNIYCYVNAFHTVSETVVGVLVMVEDSALSWRCGPSGDPLLASIDVHGDATSCKAMVGTMIGWNQDSTSCTTPPWDWFYNPQDCVGDPVPFEPCEGVAVYHTVELDYCCPDWDGACKDPSGPYAAVVAYTPDGDKAYATTSGALDPEWIGFWSDWETNPMIDDFTEYWGGWCDESAFSVSLDDGVSFNQLGLIDTDIDYLSDVAVCPDCSVIFLSTINEMESMYACCSEGEWIWEEIEIGVWDWVFECTGPYLKDIHQVDSCDSVWRSYDSGATWERVNHGEWSESWTDQLLLRLPVDDLEDCCTVYLGLQNTTDLLYSRDCGQCWNSAPTQKIVIQDVAVETENVVYILDAAGYVSKSTQYGRRPADEVDTELGSGHAISVMPDDMVIVGGTDGDSVGWSDDGGDTWTIMDDILDSGDIHVIFDPLCDDLVYAALSEGGIYRGTMSDGAWEDLEAFDYGYYGIVLGRSDGTLYASTDNITVDTDTDLGLCDRFVAPTATGSTYSYYSGVARNLTPCETDCCDADTWDYLISGLGDGPTEWFDNEPSALRICGCTTIATNSILWAIDWDWYEVADGSDGTLWAYEDCASKVGPTLLAPADEAIIACDPCACKAVPFTLKWERLCLGCSYDIELYDANDNFIMGWYEVDVLPADPAEFYITGSDLVDYLGECGVTYQWAVRLADTETDECVHSPWSDTWSFTVEAGAMTPLNILAPENGEMGIQTSNVAFSWSSVPNATSYSFVLSPNSDLSGALASAEVTGTAFQYTGTLDYMTPYYCQATAWKDGTDLITSNICAFTTMAETVPPPEPPAPAPAPVIEIPPTQMITPTWIYAIIGIGAALAVVVIVLIVRTRQRP